MPRLGAHVSAAGGLDNAPDNAAELKLDTFQFFTRPPQSGQAHPLSDEEIEAFLQACRKHGLETWHVHAPYIINLASDKSRVRHASIGILTDELRRCDRLKAATLIAHVGSATAVSREKGIEMIIDGLDQILEGYDGRTKFAIETTAGSGTVLGSTFEEVAAMIKGAKHKKHLAVCLDTAHIYAAGYGLDTKPEVEETLRQFDKTIGLKRLKAIHLNDSKVERSSRKDRHEHLGYGKIGLEGLIALLTDKRLQEIDFLLETPRDDRRADDVKVARQWFKGKKAGPKAKSQGKLV